MKTLDRFLQRWRIAKVRPYLRAGGRVLDIGCADGMFFRQLRAEIGEGIGIDPKLKQSRFIDDVQLIAGWFPQDMPDSRPFDMITMLAVLEHMPLEQQLPLAAHCAAFLKPGGGLVITVPSPRVDRILAFLKGLHLIDGMSLEQHYGYDVTKTPSIFSIGGLSLTKCEKFQFGLNNLFVFTKAAVNS